MAKNKKRYFLLCDTETCITGEVYELTFFIVDKKAETILHELSCIVYENSKMELFHNTDVKSVFSKRRLAERHTIYERMLERGELGIYSKKGINNWVIQAKGKYLDLTFVAYNASFDIRVLKQTGIDAISGMPTICLWSSCCQLFAETPRYIRYCIKHRKFSGKVILKTDCETMYNFLFNENGIAIKEPHRSRGDLLLEMEIFRLVMRYKKKLKQEQYNWLNFTIQKCFERLI